MIGHSLVELLATLTETHPALASLRSAAARLDQLYILADVFSKEQATEAIDRATPPSRFNDGARGLARETSAEAGV